MKRLSVVAEELREQVEELNKNPEHPERLRQYTGDLLTNIESIISGLEVDPTMAALALHGLIRPKAVGGVQNRKMILEMLKSDVINGDDWMIIRSTIVVHQSAHRAIERLEEKELQRVLVAAVVANIALQSKSKRREEVMEYEPA